MAGPDAQRNHQWFRLHLIPGSSIFSMWPLSSWSHDDFPLGSSRKEKHVCAQSYPTLCNPTGCSLPGSSVHGSLQARILEWVAISSSKGSSQPRDGICVSFVSCIARQILEPLGKPWKVYISWMSGIYPKYGLVQHLKSVVKLSVFLNLIYRFHAIPIKIPVSYQQCTHGKIQTQSGPHNPEGYSHGKHI